MIRTESPAPRHRLSGRVPLDSDNTRNTAESGSSQTDDVPTQSQRAAVEHHGPRFDATLDRVILRSPQGGADVICGRRVGVAKGRADPR